MEEISTLKCKEIKTTHSYVSELYDCILYQITAMCGIDPTSAVRDVPTF